MASTADVNQEGVPSGFEAVSLIEALNGPTLPSCAPVVTADGTLRSLQLSDTTPNGIQLLLLFCHRLFRSRGLSRSVARYGTGGTRAPTNGLCLSQQNGGPLLT